MAAYEREMNIRSNGCSTDEDGRMILKFSVDMIKRSQVDELGGAKWVKMCGFEIRPKPGVRLIVMINLLCGLDSTFTLSVYEPITL